VGCVQLDLPVQKQPLNLSNASEVLIPPVVRENALHVLGRLKRTKGRHVSTPGTAVGFDQQRSSCVFILVYVFLLPSLTQSMILMVTPISPPYLHNKALIKLPTQSNPGLDSMSMSYLLLFAIF
jgi:hypothetical protein